ncbi:hypothetical protein FHG66_03715 [Rubellimicrobium rubrum]|uniref:Uncharacterized protein n=1 Tax=Rubellimicrobium rubrum TaxID=2585369 RepID=A0A5C4N3C5_9RHOB|nr:hypothetical protein [Rubellimicrobium rubrum]TNC51927.1 hypothetical protein FHG66_03715 [Rubellimicrobium rubrum]
MRRLLPALALAACTEYPALDARVTPAERTAPPPALVPLAGLLAAGDQQPLALDAGDDLSARASDLAARTGAAPPPVTAPDATLDAVRLADLAARAEGLRTGGLTPEQRDRLSSGPSLP